MANTAVRVTGLRELQRAFRKMDKALSKELRDELKKAGEPVAKEAQSLALTTISNMPRSPRWADMRVGVSGKAVVYVVPRAKRRGGSGRANLKGLLQTQSLDPALAAKSDDVEKGVDNMLGKLAGDNGFN